MITWDPCEIVDLWQTPNEVQIKICVLLLRQEGALKTYFSKLKLPAASEINSFVQSASAASLIAMSPGVGAESEPEMNSAAQSPERANAATSGAVKWKHTLHENTEKFNRYTYTYIYMYKSRNLKKKTNEKYPSAEPVCSSAGRSAASPPTADPCQMCVEVVAAPEGTH